MKKLYSLALILKIICHKTNYHSKHMETGLSYTSQTMVTENNTAIKIGSGSLPVLATPAMIALMENAATQAIEPELSENVTSVGTAIHIEHLKATGIGQQIYATATLTNIEGRKLTFTVEAKDEHDLIGRGTHIRYIVDKERFMSKIQP